MPTVPTESSLGYSAVAAAPAVQSTPADFGGQVGQAEQGLGQAVDQAGNTAQQIAMQHAQIAAEADQNQRFTTLRNAVQTINYGDPANPADTGLYGKKGADFTAAYPAALKQITDLQQNLTQGVAPAMRGQFDKISRQLIDPDIRTMGSQFVQQSNAYLEDTSNARIASAHSDAIANYNNPEKFNNALEDSKTQTILKGQRNGLSQDSINQTVADNQSSLLFGVTMRLAQDNPFAAKSFYLQHAAQMTGQYQAETEKQLAGVGNNWQQRQQVEDYTSGNSAALASSVATEARAQGVDPGLAVTTAKIESNLGRSLVNPNSTAKGVFQLTDGTWAGVGGTQANRADIPSQVSLGVKALGQEQQATSAALGRQAEPWETYVTHQQGVGGGPALLKADPNALAVDVLAPLYANHGGYTAAQQAIRNNGGASNMTAGQFLDAQKARYQAAAGALPAQTAEADPSAPAGAADSATPGQAAPASAVIPATQSQSGGNAPAGAPAGGAAAPVAQGTPAPAASPNDPRTHLAGWLQEASGATDFWGRPDPVYQAQLQERIKTRAAEMEYVQGQQDRALKNTLVTAAMGGAPGAMNQAAAANSSPVAPGNGIPPALAAPPTGQAGMPVAPAAPSAPPTSLDGMFRQSPASQAAYYAADPETQHGIMEMLHANATQGPPITDAATTQYYQLRMLSATDPEKFLNVNLADPALLRTMPRQYLDPLITMQTSVDKRAISEQQRQISVVHARSVMAPDLAAAGFTPQAVRENPAMAKSYADYLGRLDETMETFKQNNGGKRPDDTAILNMGQVLLQRGAITGTGSLWGAISPTQEPYFQSLTEGSQNKFAPVNIPPNERAQVVAALQARDGHAPTEHDIGYWWMLTHQKARSGAVAQAFGARAPIASFAPTAAPVAVQAALPPAQVDEGSASMAGADAGG